MKLRYIFVIFALSEFASCGLFFLWGYHEGDKHALDNMRLIACESPSIDSFQMRELPSENGDQL